MNRRAFFVALFTPFLVRLRGLLPQRKTVYDYVINHFRGDICRTVAAQLELVRPKLVTIFEDSENMHRFFATYRPVKAGPATFDFIKA